MNILLEEIHAIPRYHSLSKHLIKTVTTQTLSTLRQEALDGLIDHLDQEVIIKRTERAIDELFEYQIRKCINATGTIIHTNLGRSNLPKQVIEHLAIAQEYNTLEYSLQTRGRGNRNQHFQQIIQQLTQAEDCLIVNNNAAAVFLVLSALGKDKEVIVSRSELVEIGGSFRIPNIMSEAGCIIKEVGTTNKTHLSDYQNAMSQDTSMLLKVHQSNFRIEGFTSSVSAQELLELKSSQEQDVVIYEDLASGALIDYSQFGLEKEPMVQDSIKAGVDIVSFSADKLLGGCQAGIIIGKKRYIDTLKKHPLNRCLRCGSLTLIALEAVLKSYLEPQVAIATLPTLQMIALTPEQKHKKAKDLGFLLHQAQIAHEIVECDATVGGGTMPTSKLGSYAVAIQPAKLQACIEHLASGSTPIIPRIENNMILFDITTICEEDYAYISEKIKELY